MTTPPGGSYPGPDPDDPFAKPPNESSTPPAAPPATPPTEETAPIQREELGYWEKQAQERAANQQSAAPGYQQNPTTAQFPTDASSQPETENPWAGYGVPASSTPPPPPPPPTYGAQQPYANPYTPGYAPGYVPQALPPNDGLGLAAMIVGIASLVLMCAYGIGLLGSPAALVMGRMSMKKIDASNGQLGGRGMAQAGFILGIIGSVLLVLVIAAIVVIVVVAANGGFDTTSSYDSY